MQDAVLGRWEADPFRLDEQRGHFRGCEQCLERRALNGRFRMFFEGFSHNAPKQLQVQHARGAILASNRQDLRLHRRENAD